MKTCNKCEGALKALKSRGVKSPQLYFILDSPEYEDVMTQDVLSGVKGRTLEALLRDAEITSYKLATLFKCYSEIYDESNATYCYENFLKKDIEESQPNLIVFAGSESRRVLVESLIKRSHFENFTCISPVGDYLSGKVSRDEYLAQLNTCYLLANGSFVDFNEIELSYVKTYSELKTYYLKELKDEELIAYDIETNAEFVYSRKFEIIGFSLAKKKKGVYVCLKSLDYSMEPKEIEMCLEFLTFALKKAKKIVVHNMLYEMPATLYKLDYDIPFDKIEDTMVMAKIMLGGRKGAGLKPNAQKLGYPDWDADLGTYINNFKQIIKRISLKKYERVREALKVNSYFDWLNTIEDKDKFIEITGYFDEIKTTLLKYYNESESIKLLRLVSNRIIKGYDEGIPGTIPYNWIPSKMLCKYGATDAVATYDLLDYYKNEFKNKSTKSVNLEKGYFFDKMEHYAGYSIINAGMHWNDKLASHDRALLVGIELRAIKYLLQSDFIKDYVFLNSAQDAIIEEVYNNYNEFFWEKYKKSIVQVDLPRYKYRLRYFDEKTQKVKQVHVKHFFDNNFLESLPNDFFLKLKNDALRRVYDNIMSSEDVEYIKSYFNPATTKNNDLILRYINSDPNLKIDKFISEVKTKYIDSEVDIEIEDECESFLLDSVKNYFNNKSDESYKALAKLIENFTPKSEELTEIKKDSDFYWLSNLDDNSQVEYYNLKIIEPIDPDSPETWDEFSQWMFVFRLYKKAVKMVSTYIDGTVGRKSIYLVDQKSLSTGSPVVHRDKPYSSNKSDNEDYLVHTNFSVGSARTGRWSSSQHTIPANSMIKMYYNSRYKGGSILQPDFSSNELRCIASAANEESMLKAFDEGLDIHKYNASQVFNIDYDDVLPMQRRFAKTLSFSTIYGSTEKSVANNYFHGDLNKAHKLFSQFYGAFPKLKSWIEERRDEALKTGKVSVLTQRFINIDIDRTDKYSILKGLRQAGNFPVQSAASTVAAVVFCDIILEQRKLNYKTKPICFIHDSLESDLYPYELFSVIEYQSKELAEGAKSYFNLALRADLSLGLSMGHECEVESFDILDEEKTKGYITLSGYKDQICDTIENWKLAYHKVEIIDEDFKEEYLPLAQFYIPRKSFDLNAMTHKSEGKMKVYVQYYTEEGSIEPMVSDFNELKFSDNWKNSKLIETFDNVVNKRR